MRVLGSLIATLLLATVVAACGGDDEGGNDATTTDAEVTRTGPCSEVEEVAVEATGRHSSRKFTASDYETNPPSGGPHHSTALEAGTFYSKPPPLGQAVHLLEHGAVIGWTNGLSAADQKAVEEAFNDVFSPDRHFQLAVVENPEMEVPFALSAWGAVQQCEEVDTSVIRPFIEEHYASPESAEGGLACPQRPRGIPNCD